MIETGLTDGSGLVNLGDGVFVPTHDFATVKVPKALGGGWFNVVSSENVELEDGRLGRLHVLDHPEVDVIALFNGEGALWIYKISGVAM